MLSVSGYSRYPFSLSKRSRMFERSCPLLSLSSVCQITICGTYLTLLTDARVSHTPRDDLAPPALGRQRRVVVLPIDGELGVHFAESCMSAWPKNRATRRTWLEGCLDCRRRDVHAQSLRLGRILLRHRNARRGQRICRQLKGRDSQLTEDIEQHQAYPTSRHGGCGLGNNTRLMSSALLIRLLPPSRLR